MKPLILNPGPVTATGAYRLSMAEYRGQDIHPGAMSMSASDAVILTRKTPAHLKAAWAEEDDRARKRDLGTVIHALVLEPFQTEAQIAVVAYDDYKTKAAREAAEMASGMGRTPILAPDFEKAKIVADRVLNHPKADKYLHRGAAEPSLYAYHDVLGIWLKARPDLITPGGDMIDLKTVGSCDLEFLKRRIYEGGWFQQCPWHAHVLERIYGDPVRDYRWICVEQEEPFAIRVLEPQEAALMHGARLNDAAARMFAACAKTGYWPAYEDVPEEPAGLPDYAYYRLEAEAEREQDASTRGVRMAEEYGAHPFS